MPRDPVPRRTHHVEIRSGLGAGRIYLCAEWQNQGGWDREAPAACGLLRDKARITTMLVVAPLMPRPSSYIRGTACGAVVFISLPSCPACPRNVHGGLDASQKCGGIVAVSCDVRPIGGMFMQVWWADGEVQGGVRLGVIVAGCCIPSPGSHPALTAPRSAGDSRAACGGRRARAHCGRSGPRRPGRRGRRDLRATLGRVVKAARLCPPPPRGRGRGGEVALMGVALCTRASPATPAGLTPLLTRCAWRASPARPGAASRRDIRHEEDGYSRCAHRPLRIARNGGSRRLLRAQSLEGPLEAKLKLSGAGRPPAPESVEGRGEQQELAAVSRAALTVLPYRVADLDAVDLGRDV